MTLNHCEHCGNLTRNPEDAYGEFVCSDCLDNEAEAAYERQCEDYYGGSGPKSLQQQQIEAWRLK